MEDREKIGTCRCGYGRWVSMLGLLHFGVGQGGARDLTGHGIVRPNKLVASGGGGGCTVGVQQSDSIPIAIRGAQRRRGEFRWSGSDSRQCVFFDKESAGAMKALSCQIVGLIETKKKDVDREAVRLKLGFRNCFFGK
ncbi:hypothetical protein QQ045_003259 [Rhodiola kirilowii]